ncbi:MAG: hypothetical protein C4521_03390 [Actinobacteria bacterium]|nr:MAG: hypothetical protein C4521_03390 [Actinomycetota bacterium]
MAGILVSVALLSVISYFNGPYLGKKEGIARALGLSELGWVGPLLILLVICALVIYLSRAGSLPKNEACSCEEARCIACGQEIIHDWRLCPYCGSLVGTIKHPNERAR